MIHFLERKTLFFLGQTRKALGPKGQSYPRKIHTVQMCIHIVLSHHLQRFSGPNSDTRKSFVLSPKTTKKDQFYRVFLKGNFTNVRQIPSPFLVIVEYLLKIHTHILTIFGLFCSIFFSYLIFAHCSLTRTLVWSFQVKPFCKKS